LGPHAFQGKVEEARRDKDRAAVFDNERVMMVEAMSKWFHFRARFTRHQYERNTLLAERSEGWCGSLVGIGRAVQERAIQVCEDDQVRHGLTPLPVMEIIDLVGF